MATRIYTEATDFDALQGHFTIEGVDNQYYLRIGALNSEDQRLIASLIEDGFVGFFQDEVRIAIAGIASTYDAANDRIEIDREPPELKIEDEYVIRFTQARPGEDGAGSIGTPGEDGEHAEIEVEDTDTGIRVRGKSGGEPDFGPWQDVRDGRDGQDGIDGEPGQDGEDGQDGEPGQDGSDGEDGDDGWSPKFATVPDGERRVLQVADWFGGGGTKPDTGQYIGATGFVATIGEGVDIRGPAGDDGENADLSNLVVSTRGELIATSSYLPQTPPAANLLNIVTWTANPHSSHVRTISESEYETNVDPAKFDVVSDGNKRGVLHVPFKPVADNINGMWVVCEDLNGTDRGEQWGIFVPWGPGSVESQPYHFAARYVLHFGIAKNERSSDGDDMTFTYYKTRSNNFKCRLLLRGYDERLPSTRCRVKVYLAGVFISVSSE